MAEPRGPLGGPLHDPLRHHGDAELADGLLDLAVNVFPGPPPAWMSRALHESIDAVGSYPSARAAEAALARRHGRPADELLATAGAAEAFTLLARTAPWRTPVVVHPQFTEPHDALVQAGHDVTGVVLAPPFLLDPSLVPDDADLVVVGNPTNPTGVLHARDDLLGLLRPGRLGVVDEAFMDAVPGEVESLAPVRRRGLVVIRSLTKHWGIPGVRAGYLLGDPAVVEVLRRAQVPWSVSASAAAAMVASSSEAAAADAQERAGRIALWRAHLGETLDRRGIEYLPSSAPFVLTRPGAGVRERLRAAGVVVRRCDTFPGLDDSWVRIAVRPPDAVARLATALDSRSNP
jgi:histidinol-phosphate/aromatic aminotransferase/cobyric acid decarboxylase-like protein